MHAFVVSQVFRGASSDQGRVTDTCVHPQSLMAAPRISTGTTRVSITEGCFGRHPLEKGQFDVTQPAECVSSHFDGAGGLECPPPRSTFSQTNGLRENIVLNKEDVWSPSRVVAPLNAERRHDILELGKFLPFRRGDDRRALRDEEFLRLLAMTAQFKWFYFATTGRQLTVTMLTR
jgi:hypothetical protein